MSYKTLELNIESAKDLKNVIVFSKPNVFAVISISGDHINNQTATTHFDGGENPRWNYCTAFTVNNSLFNQNRLSLEIKINSGETLVGTTNIPLNELFDNNPSGNSFREVSFQVTSSSGNAAGTLNLSYKFSREWQAPAERSESMHPQPSAPQPLAGAYGGYSPAHASPMMGAYGGYSPANPMAGAYGGYAPAQASPLVGAYGGYSPVQASPMTGAYGGYSPSMASLMAGAYGGYSPAQANLMAGAYGGYCPAQASPMAMAGAYGGYCPPQASPMAGVYGGYSPAQASPMAGAYGGYCPTQASPLAGAYGGYHLAQPSYSTAQLYPAQARPPAGAYGGDHLAQPNHSPPKPSGSRPKKDLIPSDSQSKQDLLRTVVLGMGIASSAATIGGVAYQVHSKETAHHDDDHDNNNDDDDDADADADADIDIDGFDFL